jgi:hypothetical protein
MPDLSECTGRKIENGRDGRQGTTGNRPLPRKVDDFTIIELRKMPLPNGEKMSWFSPRSVNGPL